jgi:predicted DNA-binding protein YlxM (UPF0122 family)
MERHYGQQLEKVIRRNGYCISELARLSNVNRRSVYNWFNQKRLKSEIIYRIGCVLNHDFSVEFPDLFDKNDFKNIRRATNHIDTGHEGSQVDALEELTWKDKYLFLLEKYTDLLTQSQSAEARVRNFLSDDNKKISA